MDGFECSEELFLRIQEKLIKPEPLKDLTVEQLMYNKGIVNAMQVCIAMSLELLETKQMEKESR